MQTTSTKIEFEFFKFEIILDFSLSEYINSLVIAIHLIYCDRLWDFALSHIVPI